ncbi:STY4528 family pathogenicity island replication protein [Pectobacterium brasiliense]|uniref:STY4528 family pathogenicity island replication protein n=1 Tax=Pectobacterium brasiliense TaxID=180957 RepID=UPI001968F748|nr:STY4528 family pathogenicity island replication protein [Pectobacterium brasiliense]MBN3264426.1 helix-turn-helix domain-containing protein [Pectobacterium brasiliense]
MGLPADSVIAFTLQIMEEGISRQGNSDPSSPINERSGLLYLGNVHDAVPRRLFLDSRLSPLDKTAWVMIRLYAQQNDGAVFPTYDELQLQLASPHAEKASRETISRTLLMLRITGWLSLCKRVRDEYGRVRGNIYAQHDEPLSCRDAETFDPGWLDLVARSCGHKNKSVRMTALNVLETIRNDPSMRHRHSRVAMIEARLDSPSTPSQLASLQRGMQPSSNSELSKKQGEIREKSLSSESELSLKSTSYNQVRKSNCNVRSFTHSVNKKTYVPESEHSLALPEALLCRITADDADMLTRQLTALPAEQASALLTMLNTQLKRGQLANPLGWLLSMMKCAREGRLVLPAEQTEQSAGSVTLSEMAKGRASAAITPMVDRPASELPESPPAQATSKASQERVSNLVADIRARILTAGK